jgi:hypothetical protein
MAEVPTRSAHAISPLVRSIVTGLIYRRRLDQYPLHLVQRHIVGPAIIELSGAG